MATRDSRASHVIVTRSRAHRLDDPEHDDKQDAYIQDQTTPCHPLLAVASPSP